MTTKTDTNWQYGPSDSFWMEDNTPSCNSYHYHLDANDVSQPAHDLLTLLGKLKVVDFGCFYETIEMIRIKERGQ